MKKSFVIALFISIAAVLWVLSGVLGKDTSNHESNEVSKIATKASQSVESERLREPEQLAQKKIPEVRVRHLIAESIDDNIEITGRTKAARQVVVRGELEGQVASINVKKGERVVKGQILAKLGARDRFARLEEARQLLKQRQIQFKASKELAEKGFNSRVRLAEKQAELKAAQAQVKQEQDAVSRIIIKAPFGGIINDKMVEIGDYVTQGTQMFEIVDLNPIKITGHLTEKQISFLKEGDAASALLLNSHRMNGDVTFIASSADIETRTFEMEMSVPNDDFSVKEGLTAKILVPFKEDKAYKISPSVLSLADDGTVGVKLVNQNNRVEFKLIRFLKDTPDYLWIGGLEDNIRLITVGQEFVIPGQEVKPIEVKNVQSDQNLL